MSKIEWTIPDLLQLSGGYWATCALHAAVRLDFFTALDGVERTADEVARLQFTEPRATGMLLDALTAQGLLAKTGERYRTTPFASDTLSKQSPRYLGHIIMHHHHLVAGWSRLHEAVTSGEPVRDKVSHRVDDTVRESFLMGMFNLASQIAPKISGAIDLSSCHRLLDLGGGPGTYAIHFCLTNPRLTAVVYDLPTTREFAEKTIDRFGLTERISFAAGDYHEDAVPGGFDAAWLSHVLHADGPAACAELVGTAVAALNPGGTLLVQEFILDDTKDGPPFPALFSLNMLLGTDAGQSYSEGELISMLEQAGLTDIRRLSLELPNGAGIIMGSKP